MHAGHARGRALPRRALGQRLQLLARQLGGEVEVVGVIQGGRQVGHDAGGAVRAGGHKVYGRDVGDGLAVGVQGEVQGDAVPAQVLDAEQRGQHVLGMGVWG